MAERKSVNKYYPPDWDPSKGSVNNYVGQHPLRDRAKKLGQGILVIRFEMPYNIWCGGCNAHIGMGVRYNAEKSKTGKYYTTPIYKFRMKCHLCDNYFEIQTDPKNHDYVILEGARRKEQRWDPKENEQIVPEDKATQKKLATDPMFKIEHGTDDRQRGKKAVSNLALLEVSKEGMKDDYILNKIARHKFREEKKSLKKIQEEDDALLKRSSLNIPLLKEKEEDVKMAGLIKLRATETYDEKQVQKRKEIDSRPIFHSKKRARTDDDAEAELPQSKKLKIIRENIIKAKMNSSTSPFDRMKTNTIGIGLTKDRLGIRAKGTRSSTDNKIVKSKEETKEESCVLENDVKEEVEDKLVSESDIHTETSSSLSSDTSQVSSKQTKANDSTDDLVTLEDERLIHSKHADSMAEENLNDTDKLNDNSCLRKSSNNTKECNELTGNIGNNDENQVHCSSSQINQEDDTNVKVLKGIAQSPDKSDKVMEKDSSVFHEKGEANEENFSSEAHRLMSLVAAYSDSDDTDS